MWEKHSKLNISNIIPTTTGSIVIIASASTTVNLSLTRYRLVSSSGGWSCLRRSICCQITLWVNRKKKRILFENTCAEKINSSSKIVPEEWVSKLILKSWKRMNKTYYNLYYVQKMAIWTSSAQHFLKNPNLNFFSKNSEKKSSYSFFNLLLVIVLSRIIHSTKWEKIIHSIGCFFYPMFANGVQSKRCSLTFLNKL